MLAKPSPPGPRRRSTLALAAGVLAVSAGCNLGNTPPPLPPRPQPPAGPIVPAEVSDDGFAQALEGVLRQGRPTAERQGLLAGVVRRQMSHAAERLKAQQNERGLASVLGGLYLIRAGEYRPEMMQGAGDEALARAVKVVAATGDEGRSRALYELRRGLLSPQHPEQGDITGHLDALQKWTNEQQTLPSVTPLEAAGIAQSQAVGRALLDPSDEALNEARGAVQRWVDAGLAFQATQRAAGRGALRREEAVEGMKALSSGAATITSLLLRHGDVGGAAMAVESSPFRQVAPQGLAARLNAAAREDNVDAWRELLEILLRAQQRDEETAVERSLVQAAAFQVAIEVYRREPASVDIALHLATTLSAYGMPEAAPAVLAEAAAKHPEPRVLSLMLDLVLNHMAREEESDEPASARRMFAAARPLLEAANQPSLRGRVRPSAARVQLLAGGIEARSGEINLAREIYLASSRAEPSVEALHALAEIERQLGSPQNALGHIAQILALPEAQRDPLAQAEALLLASDLQRDLGSREKAREEALKAYQLALFTRQHNAAGAAGLARAERLLARVLDRLGDDAGAARAIERAMHISRSEPRAFGLAALEAQARAYLQRDLAAARKAGQETFGVQLRDDELVYIAIWLQLLERELGARPDGTAAKLLASVDRGPRWTGRLASWAAGKLSDDALLAAARTPGQRTEALFYRTLARRAEGKGDSAQGLREVVAAPTLDLLESRIARDLLAGNDRKLAGPLPTAAP